MTCVWVGVYGPQLRSTVYINNDAAHSFVSALSVSKDLGGHLYRQPKMQTLICYAHIVQRPGGNTYRLAKDADTLHLLAHIVQRRGGNRTDSQTILLAT